MDTHLLISFATAMVAILNPIGGIPVFLSYTAEDRPGVRHDIAILLCLCVFGLLSMFIFLGQGILDFFGITIASFRIAGGIILLLMGIQMTRGEGKVAPKRTTAEKEHLSNFREAQRELRTMLVPVGVPFLVGPGAISTAILFANEAVNPLTQSAMVLVLLGVCILLCLALIAGELIMKLIGSIGLDIATRILGLFLAAVAVQFILEGLVQTIPALG